MMHGRGKSDFAIVAVKLANKAERSAAELVEPRAETKGNAGWQSTRRTQRRISVSKALARIRQALAVWTQGGNLPNTRFLLHQPMGGARGPATDIEIEARELIKMHERLVQIIATETGQSVERVRKDTDRNYWMSASEAIDYGIANKIISSIKELK
jgi:Clp protease